MSQIRLSRRLRLVRLPSQDANAGLVFDRFLLAQEVKEANQRAADTSAWLRDHGFAQNFSWPSRADFAQEVSEIAEPEIYAPFFHSYTAAIRSLEAPGLVTNEFNEVSVQGSLTTGLGAASVIENGIALHHTYGVPWLQGSGLKGVCSRYCRTVLGETRPECRRGGELYEILFGSTEAGGWVTFHDALPPPGRKAFLVPNVMTPHHSDYQQDASAPPADYDSPTPVPFLSVRGTLQLALSGPSGWTSEALNILLEALANVGFGAKTSSGEGRMIA